MAQHVHNEISGETSGTVIQAGHIGSLSTGGNDAEHTGSGASHRDTAVQTGEDSIQINGVNNSGFSL
ncbi:hypothetical protein ACH4FX_06825 [Streptomyces sp. NPDC018019]|uniref:hypothetical protein n=1 Tax=Streptomyces sp. NPDC018019 TaxID=3365030 RepID=UPI003787E6D7